MGPANWNVRRGSLHWSTRRLPGTLQRRHRTTAGCWRWCRGAASVGSKITNMATWWGCVIFRGVVCSFAAAPTGSGVQAAACTQTQVGCLSLHSDGCLERLLRCSRTMSWRHTSTSVMPARARRRTSAHVGACQRTTAHARLIANETTTEAVAARQRPRRASERVSE